MPGSGLVLDPGIILTAFVSLAHNLNFMRSYSIFLLLCISLGLQAQRYSTQMGPVNLNAGLDADGTFTYALNYGETPVLMPSPVGFDLAKPQVRLEKFILGKVDSTIVDESWKPVWGEVDAIHNNYREIKFHLTDKSSSAIRLNIIFRVFKDGIGFRYEFPTQDHLEHFIVKSELTGFAMFGNNKAFWIPGDFETNEYQYNTTLLSEINAEAAVNREKDIAVTAPIHKHAVQTPLMMVSSKGLYINIHEAALVNYPAMNLLLNKTNLQFNSVLVPDAVGNSAYLQAPFQTPWRTVLVSSHAADMLTSKTILNLNEPSRIKNTSWIKPQKFVGVWWEMHTGKATWQLKGGKHGANTINVKRYIDFAARHKFDGVLVEGWNQGWEDWFGNWKENVFDFVSPYKDYNMTELKSYAKKKGVKLIMHHETSGAVTNYERRMDTAFRYMIRNDINTVKTGYVGKIIPRGEHHDGQWMVNHYNRVAEKAASYKIMVDAHEPVHPTGLHRTWPNWMANEAARGAEFNNAPTLGISPEHNTILPFTRLMGGPMDYTPGLFHMRLNQFDSTRTTRVRSTLAKQLALYITMYSPLQMAADLPENYEKYMDAFQFIKDVPVNWSDTRVLEAEPGDFITIARREKGKPNWFLGSITDENANTYTLHMDFLEPGKKYNMTVYADAPNAHWDKNPEAYIISKKTVTSKDTLMLELVAGGGTAISFIQIK